MQSFLNTDVTATNQRHLNFGSVSFVQENSPCALHPSKRFWNPLVHMDNLIALGISFGSFLYAFYIAFFKCLDHGRIEIFEGKKRNKRGEYKITFKSRLFWSKVLVKLYFEKAYKFSFCQNMGLSWVKSHG